MDNNYQNSNGNNGSHGMGCGGAFLLFIVMCACIWLLTTCTNNNKSTNSSISSKYYGNSNVTSACLMSGCNSTHMSGSLYCYKHTCHKSGCNDRVAENSSYCSKHQPQPVTTRPSTSTKKNTEKKDPYNISQYDDVDDFYDDWYDDFDGYDDAEWYWDENH